MGGLLEKAGASFLRAFFGSLVVLAPGILAAPNLNRGVALGIAALIASIAAGLKSIQAYVPQLSIVGSVHDEKWKPAGAIADSFLRAFLAAFITSMIGILNMPSLSGWKSLVVAALVGAFTAGVKTVEGALTKGEWPLRDQGIDAPKPAPPVEAVPEATTVISA